MYLLTYSILKYSCDHTRHICIHSMDKRNLRFTWYTARLGLLPPFHKCSASPRVSRLNMRQVRATSAEENVGPQSHMPNRSSAPSTTSISSKMESTYKVVVDNSHPKHLRQMASYIANEIHNRNPYLLAQGSEPTLLTNSMRSTVLCLSRSNALSSSAFLESIPSLSSFSGRSVTKAFLAFLYKV